VLVISEVALSLILLVGARLLIDFVALQSVDPGSIRQHPDDAPGLEWTKSSQVRRRLPSVSTAGTDQSFARRAVGGNATFIPIDDWALLSLPSLVVLRQC
jgi:hypothetical protein